MNQRLKWFEGKKWGLFSHYLAEDTVESSMNPVSAASKYYGVKMTVKLWNETIDAFDVQLLAKQIYECGAEYYFITIGQNDGYYCSPNSTYDKFTSITPSKCSKRDLINDLADALNNYGIDLLVYLPSGAPVSDPVAVEKLGWEWGYKGNWPYMPPVWGDETTGKRLVEFQRKWEAVICEWSERWKEKVKGWWFDGCFFSKDMYDYPDEPNYHSFLTAIRSGNSNALVALSTDGTFKPFRITYNDVDYTAGEVSKSLPLKFDISYETKSENKNLSEKKLHIISYLGDAWARGKPRFSDFLVAGYTQYVNEHNGIITWDIPLNLNGSIPEEYFKQLKNVNSIINEIQ